MTVSPVWYTYPRSARRGSNPRKQFLSVGDKVTVKVIKNEDGKISLSMKALEEVAPEEDTNGEETVSYKDEGDATTGLGALLAGLKL